MTQQVRKGYRNHRKASWAAVLVVLVAAALAVVIPALGATDGTPLPPQSANKVIPTVVNVGGSNFSCTAPMNGRGPSVVGPAGMSTFKVSNPPNSATPVVYNSTNTAGTATPLPAGITFTLSGVNGSGKGKYFSFSVTGARVFHIGINGGSDTAWYDYVGYTDNNAGHPYANGVDGDGSLHATEKTPGDASTLYAASYTTFCYKPVVKIEGNVYNDIDGNGSKNGSDGAFSTARTVTLDNGASTTTDSSGNYTFYVATGSTYKVCVTQDLSTEAETQPFGNTAPVGKSLCHASPDVAGYQLTPTDNVQTINFGLTAGLTGGCNVGLTSPTTGGATYGATLSGSNCSTKVNGQQLVFNTYTDTTGQFASLRPTSYSGPPCDVGANTNCVTVLEQLAWDISPGSTPKTLKYDDTFPYTTYEDMPFCKVDPTTGTFAPAQVLPQKPSSTTYHTSCLFDSAQKLKTKTGVWYVERIDEVYSAQDGGRGLVG